MAVTAELLPRPRGVDVQPVLAPLIGLPPAGVVPDLDRPAIGRYAADVVSARAELVDTVDRVGAVWEHTIATRALEARAELVASCRRAAALHDELVTLHAAARWLRGFPWRSSWAPEPYTLHLPGGHQAAVPEILGAIEDACDVDERLRRIARQEVPSDPPYAGPPAPKMRAGSAPAKNALAQAGVTLRDVAELTCVELSTVSCWLAGKRRYPDELPDALEQLVDAETAARIVSLIPGLAVPNFVDDLVKTGADGAG